MSQDRYTHGHHDSVLRSHRWRRASNSAAYLIDRLEPGMSLLDVGCGPGTLTTDLGRRVAPGRTVGVDSSEEVLDEARRTAADVDNVEFQSGDAYGLEFADGTFDVVHAHQLLHHLGRPVDALAEMRRVLSPGGILASREVDYAAVVWFPADEYLERWNALYHEISTRNGAEADAGRRLAGWVRQAGFEDLTVGSSTWTFADPSDRKWWADSWAERCLSSAFADQALEYGLSTRGELEAVADGWRAWSRRPDGVFALLHFEVLARK